MPSLESVFVIEVANGEFLYKGAIARQCRFDASHILGMLNGWVAVPDWSETFTLVA